MCTIEYNTQLYFKISSYETYIKSMTKNGSSYSVVLINNMGFYTLMRAYKLIHIILGGIVAVKVSAETQEPSVAERRAYASAVRCVLHH